MKDYSTFTRDEIALYYACGNGQLEVVKYLLTSPDLIEHANKDSALKGACLYGQLEVVKYLLTSPDLTEHADIHADDDSSLKGACLYRRLEVVNYLLYDMNMQVHPYIYQQMIESGHDKADCDILRHMVAKRDLFFKINDLTQGTATEKNTSKPKI